MVICSLPIKSKSVTPEHLTILGKHVSVTYPISIFHWSQSLLACESDWRYLFPFEFFPLPDEFNQQSGFFEIMPQLLPISQCFPCSRNLLIHLGLQGTHDFFRAMLNKLWIKDAFNGNQRIRASVQKPRAKS